MSTVQSKDSALFVYLAWGTRHNLPVLDCDQIRQAAYLAITNRTRSLLCHVVAISGTAGSIHLIVRFPPSLSVSTVARTAQDAGGEAVAHQSETFQGQFVCQRRLWGSHCTTRTLPQIDAAEARAYLRHQIAAENIV